MLTPQEKQVIFNALRRDALDNRVSANGVDAHNWARRYTDAVNKLIGKITDMEDGPDEPFMEPPS